MLDGVIQGARAHNLRLVLLWFGSWKNGLSSYPPDWVKRDFERFPRAQIVGIRPLARVRSVAHPVHRELNIELLSPFGDATRDADARAFAALMRHIKAVDGQQHTVIMIQVENEMGMQGDTRDRSPAANKAFDGPVPKELMDYLQPHKDTLIPELRKVWEAAGFKTSGTWEEVFGKGRATDEIFMAWNFARYVDRVVEAGKAEYPIPMFTNCPQDGFGRAPRRSKEADRAAAPCPTRWTSGEPGRRRSICSGPTSTAPTSWGSAHKYTQSGNPLFIPETRGDMEAKCSTPSDAMMRSVSR